MLLLRLSKKRKCNIMTHVVFVAELRHFLQYVFINWRCELSPDGFSQLPARTVAESLQTIPPTISLSWLSSITSYLVSPFFPPFFHASEHPKWEYAFNECSPCPCPQGPFHLHKPRDSFLALHLLFPLVLPFTSVNVHFINTLFDGFKTVITNPVVG